MKQIVKFLKKRSGFISTPFYFWYNSLMIRRTIKISFIDFWRRFDMENDFIYQTLIEKYDVIIDDENPDILFCSSFSEKAKKRTDVTRVFYTGQNINPKYYNYEYSISFDANSERNLYLPLSIIDYNCKKITLNEDQVFDRKFCNFIYSQDKVGDGAILRKIICDLLMKYKHVDCPGCIMNNMTAPSLSNRFDKNWHQSKIEFIKDYKFTIAVENMNNHGYNTEKLLDPLMAGSIPIYWGGVGETYPFPKDSMICVNDFDSFDDLIDRIKQVDNNKEEYMRLWRNNPLLTGELPSYKKIFLDFIEKILDKNADNSIIHP